MKRSALAAEILRTVAAGIVFLVLARLLSVSDFGVIATVTAWVAIAGPVAALGAPYHLLRTDGSRRDAITLARRTLLSCVFVTGPLVLLVMTIGVHVTAGLDTLNVAALCVGELLALLYGLFFTTLGARIGDGRLLLRTSVLGIAPRAIAVLGLIVLGSSAIRTYALLLATTSVMVILGECVRRDSWRPIRFSLSRWRESMGYGTSGLLSRLNDDMDKVVLSSLAPLAVGAYSVPYRLTFYLIIPGRALLVARMGNWYRRQGNGVRHDVVRTIVVGVTAAGTGFILLAALWPAVNEILLAGKYDVPALVVAVLGVSVCCRVVQYALGELLFARGRFRGRLISQGVALVVTFGLLILLIPRDPLLGASVATLVGEMVAMLGLIFCLARGGVSRGEY